MPARKINIDQVPDTIINQIASANSNANNAVSLANTANLQGVRLGAWNASTNTPTLSTDASAIAAGAFYDVTIAGTQSITGTSTVFSVGDRLAKVANVWVRLPTADSAKIANWQAQSYLLGSQVNYLGQDWVANINLISTNIPGNSTKWDSRLSAYQDSYNRTIDVSNDSPTSWSIRDQFGNVAFEIDSNGVASFSEKASQFLAKLVANGFPTKSDGTIDLSGFSTFSSESDTTFSVRDLNGNVGFELDANGNFKFKELASQFLAKLVANGFPTKVDGSIDLSVFDAYTGENADSFAICDRNGYIGFLLNSTNTTFIGQSSTIAPTAGAMVEVGNYPADILMIATYGQSNATGNTFVSGDVSANVLGFARDTLTDGIVTQYDATTAKSVSLLNAFYGANFLPITYGNGSQTEAAMNQFLRLIVSENQKNLTKLDLFVTGTNPSQGGTQINVLTKVSGLNISDNPNWVLSDGIVWTQTAESDSANTLYMCRFLQSVWYAKKFADAQNKTFSLPVLNWIHGEAHQSELSGDSYYSAMYTAFDLINLLIKKITGQKDDVKFLVFQTAITQCPLAVSYASLDSIPQAQLNIAKNRPNTYFSFSMLPFESTATDYVHYLNVSYSLMGIYQGIQAKRLIVDGKITKPITPLTFNVIQKITGEFILEVKYQVPVLPLSFDSTQPYFQTSNKQRGVRPNYGFSLKKILYVSEEIPSSVLYTKATAITAIPVRLKKNALIIKIRTNANSTAATFEYYQFSGDATNSTSWSTLTNWTLLTGLVESDYELLDGVSNIAIRRDDTIVFKCKTDPRGYFLKYGYEVLSDSTGGGNLRDSQGDKVQAFVETKTYNFHNWSPLHKLEIV